MTPRSAPALTPFVVAVEGPDGAGKSTLVRSLSQMLAKQGCTVESYGLPSAEMRSNMTGQESPAELIVKMTADMGKLSRQLRSSTKAKIVLLDRWAFSTFIYQCQLNYEQAWLVEVLQAMLAKYDVLRPDLTVLLNVPYEQLALLQERAILKGDALDEFESRLSGIWAAYTYAERPSWLIGNRAEIDLARYTQDELAQRVLKIIQYSYTAAL